MDKKELLKRWALAYTEPSLFYVPWKGKHHTYTVEILRYANIQFSKLVSPSSNRYKLYTYMITDEICYSWLNAFYYIYDKNGNYYNSIGEKFKSKKPLNFQNTIKLPKGEYFYKEMISLHGCKLIEGIIAFSVTDEHNTIVMHHQANLLSINYNIELEKIDFNYDSTIYTEEREEKRAFSPSHRDELYLAEMIEDTQYIPNTIDIGIPIIKVKKISNYKKDYTNDVSLDVAMYDVGEIDEILKDESNDEFVLPRTPELWNLTYKIKHTYSLSKYKTFYYSIKINDITYDDDKSNSIGSYHTKNISGVYSTFGKKYNNYSRTILSWYYYPHGNDKDWQYEGYKATTVEITGFDGQIGSSKLVGKNTVLFSKEETTYHLKRIYTNVSPETGEKTIREEEIPSTSLTTNTEIDNFNELTIFETLLVGIANNYRLGDICNIYLYKEKGTSLTCYGLGGSNKLLEVRYLENGNDIANKDADSIYAGVLIAREERQEE